jgi:hypothetical protein
MPLPFTLVLIAIAVVLFGARIILRALPLGTKTRPFTVLDLALVVVGTLGLVLHCAAMFYRDILRVIPGSAGYVTAVNQMGAGSVILYVIPVILVLVGLRRQQPIAVTLLAVTFVTVGITMYNHGPLAPHLTAIFASGTALAAILALLVPLPSRSRINRASQT